MTTAPNTGLRNLHMKLAQNEKNALSALLQRKYVKVLESMEGGLSF